MRLMGHRPEPFDSSSDLFVLIETPQGFACLTITVPQLLGNDLEIVSAENISL